MDDHARLLDRLMNRLSQVTHLDFRGISGSHKSGWEGQGQGTVQVARTDAATIMFTETGSWITREGRQIDFSNVYRWTQQSTEIGLEHLRFGMERPVYLFDLKPVSETKWVSVDPHVCQEDCYQAELLLAAGSIDLCWAITGPDKDETIRYVYQ